MDPLTLASLNFAVTHFAFTVIPSSRHSFPHANRISPWARQGFPKMKLATLDIDRTFVHWDNNQAKMKQLLADRASSFWGNSSSIWCHNYTIIAYTLLHNVIILQC